MIAARSLRFNPSGTKLFAGLKNQIRIFDVSVPGRDCETVKTFDKKEGGLGGIISSIAVSLKYNKSLHILHIGYSTKYEVIRISILGFTNMQCRSK